MPLFTRCNIGLGCPQDASVKFLPKIPNRSFIITVLKCHFWGVSKKRADLECIALNANELHIPAPSPEDVSLHCISNLQQ